MSEPDEVVAWLVADRLAEGSVNLLAGKPKVGKSTLARDLALQVGRGGMWLSSACVSDPVWYLAFEDKRSEVRRHFRQMGATGSKPVRFLFEQPGTADVLAQIHALAEREKPALIIVVTLQRLIRAKDLNDYAEVTTRLTPMFAAGQSPKGIAKQLNGEGVPGPAGATWHPSTINGNVSRGTGLLNNELYIGRLVWNRLHT